MSFLLFMEIIGYIGTGLVIISMLMTTLVRLRILNMCGALLSMLYAIAVRAWPVVILNAALILIQVFQLIRMRCQRRAAEDAATDA